MTEVITSPSNEKIKRLRALGTAKGRKRYDEFFIEGPVVLREILAYCLPKEILGKESFFQDNEDFLHFFQDAGVPLFAVYDDVLERALPTVHSQGVVGIFSQWEPPDITGDVLVFLDGVQDPGNLGGIFRSAEAFGVGTLLLGEETVDVYNPKTVRSTMASLARMPFRQKVTAGDLCHLKEQGYEIAVLDPKGETMETYFSKKVIYVAGNEGNGVSDEVMALGTRRIRIPMASTVESLNVNVALSICLYEDFKRRNKGE